MGRWICTACGTQFAGRDEPPAVCPICDDDRQPPNIDEVPWTTMARLLAGSYQVRVEEHEPGLIGIGTEPAFAIGQRPILVRTPAGNVLWDCMAHLDDDVEPAVREQGGLIGIAISHPHFYTTMVEWADRFDVPIHLHVGDRAWVMRPSPWIPFWNGDRLLLAPGATVIRLGGHFPGAGVLHREQAADGPGVLLTGDTIMPIPASGWATFMSSYPNMLPLPTSEIRRIRDVIAPYAFDRIYAAWFGRDLTRDAHAAVINSADRYLAKLDGDVAITPRPV